MVSEKRLQKINQVQKNRQKDLVVVLEDIYDPHNAAAIFRTMEGFGIGKAYLIFDKQEPFNPKKVGKASSSSANKWLDFCVYRKRITKSKIPISKQAPNSKFKEINNPAIQQFSQSSNPTSSCLSVLKKQGYKICATVLDKEAKNIYQFNWPEKIALLVGNEHAGLSETAVKLSDYKLYIPMQGMVQSLNVSVATAIFISEIYRIRKRLSKSA